MDLKIECRNIEMAPRWETEIEARMADLQGVHADLTHGRVTLTKNRHHKKLDDVAEVLVLVTLPGRQTMTARKEDKTFEEAIRAAFQAVAIELRKFREKRAHTDVRLAPLPQERGVISKIFRDKEYGFILRDGGGEVYFHAHALQGMPFDALEDGMEVLFNEEAGQKGPQASVVTFPHPAAAKGL